MAIKWNDYETNVLITIIKYFDELNFKPNKFTGEISNIFKEDIKCEVRSEESIRKKIRILEFDQSIRENDVQYDKEILNLVKKSPITLQELSERFELPKSLITRFIRYIASSNIPITVTDSEHVVYNTQKNGVSLFATIKEEIPILEVENSKKIKIGVVSDTHFGSKSAEIVKLNHFYEYCHSQGITTMLHAGDMLDGIKVYKGQEYEQNQYGFDSQTNLVIDCYPKIEGITTYTILGNHDYSFISLCDTDPFEKICSKRSDIVCVGKYFGDIQIGDFKIALHHPDAGGAYALSYKAQKILESVKTYYDAYIIGHYHTSISLFNYHSRWACLAGSFQNETMFSRRKGLRTVLGGFIVEMEKNINGTVFVKPTWLDYND